MDKHGYFNLSIATGNSRVYIDNADIVVIEVLEGLPHAMGGQEESVHISEVDMVVEGEHGPAIQLPSREPTEVDKAIAANVIPYLCDGATIQLGIGGVPDALGVMIAESDLKDLGMHTEFATDAFYKLFAAGKITGRSKNIDKGKAVFGVGAGTQDLYDWIDWNPGVAAYPSATSTTPTSSPSWTTSSPSTAASASTSTARSAPRAPAPPDQRHRRPGGLPHRRGQEQGRQGLHLHVQHLQGQGRHAQEPASRPTSTRATSSPARAARPSTWPPSTAWSTWPAPAPGSAPRRSSPSPTPPSATTS